MAENMMKAAVFVEPEHVGVRGISERPHNTLVGHEAIGIIDEVGADVHDMKPGDFVIVPFTHCCGHCEACEKGYDGNCFNMEPGGNAGYQAEYMRATWAGTALIKIPGTPADYTDEQIASLLALSDVMATGYHAAWSSRIEPGDTVVIYGDGAVGLCAVIGAKLLGAGRIIMMSRHEDRAALAREFGATDIVEERGDEAVARVMEMTDGYGADAVLECVGSALSNDTAMKVARCGAVVGRVGLPHGVEADIPGLFYRNVGLRGGPAPVRHYDTAVDHLLDLVLNGEIHPGRVFTAEFTLDDIQAAYDAMDQRKTIKSLLRVSEV